MNKKQKIYLKDLGESNAYVVLSEKDKKYIAKLKGKQTATKVAGDFGVSRQRIAFLWLTPERQEQLQKGDNAKRMERYRTNKKFKAQIEAKRQRYLTHRKEVLTKIKNK